MTLSRPGTAGAGSGPGADPVGTGGSAGADGLSGHQYCLSQSSHQRRSSQKLPSLLSRTAVRRAPAETDCCAFRVVGSSALCDVSLRSIEGDEKNCEHVAKLATRGSSEAEEKEPGKGQGKDEKR